MSAQVTWKLSVPDMQLVLESLEQRNELLIGHGKMKGENTEARKSIRESREKSIRIQAIIDSAKKV